MKKMIYALATVYTVAATSLFADEAPGMPPMRAEDFTQTLMMIAIALLFFYFILWRPEQKRRKALESQRETMKAGDRVTAMGIVGTIVRVLDHTVIIKMYDGTSKIEVVKGAITDVFENEGDVKVDASKKSDKIEKLEKE